MMRCGRWGGGLESFRKGKAAAPATCSAAGLSGRDARSVLCIKRREARPGEAPGGVATARMSRYVTRDVSCA